MALDLLTWAALHPMDLCWWFMAIGLSLRYVREGR